MLLDNRIHRIPREIPASPRGKAIGQGRHDLHAERAINLVPDGAEDSIALQAMTLAGDNDTLPCADPPGGGAWSFLAGMNASYAMRDPRCREKSHDIHAARYLESSLFFRSRRLRRTPSGAEISTTEKSVMLFHMTIHAMKKKFFGSVSFSAFLLAVKEMRGKMHILSETGYGNCFHHFKSRFSKEESKRKRLKPSPHGSFTT